MSSDRRSHAARPTDLVALVTFDDEVRENQAVTLDGLGHPDRNKARPLNAALAQWLHLGRRMWINVVGREVRGIATARDLSAKHAWIVDTLIDAAGEDAGDEVVEDLLRQAIEAAAKAEVTHLLLRTADDAPGRSAAMRAGFRPALVERLWQGTLETPCVDESVLVRPGQAADEVALFQLYSRAVPVEARTLLGMTREEWSAVRDRRWLRGGSELVAERDGLLIGFVAFLDEDDRIKFDLVADDAGAAGTLLAEIVDRGADRPGQREALSLTPRSAGAVEQAIAECGLEPGREYVQLCRRIARPVEAEAPARAGLPLPTGGGA